MYRIARSGPEMLRIFLPVSAASISRVNSSMVSGRRTCRRSTSSFIVDRWARRLSSVRRSRTSHRVNILTARR